MADRPGDPRRRAFLATIHVAKKALAMADDDYRALLARIVGTASAADCTVAELSQVIDELRRLGFAARGAQRVGPVRADHPTARKARALWISLGMLGAIDDPSEHALEAFGRRQLGVDKLQWMDQRQGFRLIEALKAIAERHGWRQGVPRNASQAAQLWLLKSGLVHALTAKLAALGVAPIGVVAGEHRDWTVAELDTAARHLARQLAAAQAATR